MGRENPHNLKFPLRDGDEDRPDDEAYADSYFFNCSSKNKPLICGRDTTAPVTEEDVYSGCYGRVVVNFYPFNQSGSKGVAAGLNAVQKLKDGERLGGNPVTADAFEDGYADEFGDDDDISINDPVEVWLDIPGYEGEYQASNLGRIKSLRRPLTSIKHGRTYRWLE